MSPSRAGVLGGPRRDAGAEVRGDQEQAGGRLHGLPSGGVRQGLAEGGRAGLLQVRRPLHLRLAEGGGEGRREGLVLPDPG